MDLAAGSAATRLACGRCATVGMGRIRFREPVHVGDEVSVHAAVLHTGRISITMDVQTWIRSRDGYVARMAHDGTSTFGAIDSAGRPRILGPVGVESG